MNGSSLPLTSATQAGKQPALSAEWLGHSREEVTRLLLQALTDLGHREAAAVLSRDSGYDLESETVASFRQTVLRGRWDKAEELLFDSIIEPDGRFLATGADPAAMRFWLREQKYLELLEANDNTSALMVLRTELTPLDYDTDRLHFLSTLLMSPSPQALRAKADWDGADGNSRRDLLSRLSSTFASSTLLAHSRDSLP